MARHEVDDLLDTSMFITDGGLETTLIFRENIDLPDFAAFPLLETETGREVLTRYYTRYLDIAHRDAVGIVLDTPTWRANPDWGHRLGYDREALASLNRQSVEFVRTLAASHPRVVSLVDGVIGPRGDGYVVGASMTPTEASDYHMLQLRAFREAGADMASAITMTNVEEAIGIATAAANLDLPIVISFTVETDGRLPTGQTLAAAVAATDSATGGAPLHYMINCAHPSHFSRTLEQGGVWVQRVGAIRANASQMSHAELDAATELVRGDPTELARDYVSLRSLIGSLRVVGGCCGTDDEHVSLISAALSHTI